jgi:hypothetical protein
MDALVWALTELFDSKGRGVLDFYREQSEEIKQREAARMQ